MPIPLTATEVLDRDFLGVRMRMIDLAATLDRIDRAEGPVAQNTVADQSRLEKIRRGLQILSGDAADRAEQLQLLFSLPYQHDWQES